MNQISQRIRTLIDEGKTYAEIAETLNREGFRNKRGKPFKGGAVQMRHSRGDKTARKPSEITEMSDNKPANKSRPESSELSDSPQIESNDMRPSDSELSEVSDHDSHSRFRSAYSDMNIPELTIIQDTLEQTGWKELFEAPCVVDTLTVGDYSIRGMETLIAVERKSLPDLLQSLTRERDRFERELLKTRGYNHFFVLIEANAPDVLAGRFGQYGSRINAKSIWESIAAFSNRYAPFLFCGDRRTAARLCESLLLKAAREPYRVIEAMEKANRQLRKAG
jgi:DNA excision repair protein ERCC-4